jgi:hypothetical protein
MNDISQTWATIPDFPLFEIQKGCDGGVYKVRRKKTPKGVMFGRRQRGFIGGKNLTPDNRGCFALKTGPYAQNVSQPGEALWRHVYMGETLLTPAERRDAATAKRREEEKRIAEQVDKMGGQP